MLEARSSVRFNINRPFKAIISLVTLMAFVFSMVSYDLSWAATVAAKPTSLGSAGAGSPGVLKELNVATFSLPEYLGHVKYAWQSQAKSTLPALPACRHDPRSTVIHIQDAHCNYAAQRKIAEIVEYLNKEYDIGTVNLEGGAKDYDLSIFTNLSDKAIRGKASDYFVKEGLVNGAEYFAINNPGKITLWGIEDTKLYIDNLNTYRSALKYKDEIDRHLKTLTHILTNLKTKIYSKGLLDLDAIYSQYKVGTLDFKGYLAYLVKAAKKQAIDIKTFTNIHLLSKALADEKGIDFKKANNQRDDLVGRLQKKSSKKLLEELVVKIVEFKSEKISRKDFYTYLAGRADFLGVDLSYFPDLQKYIAYISMYDAIDKTKTMDEAEDLEGRIKERLYQNDKEKKLDKLYKNLAILKDIFGISLTKEDYRYYKDNEDSFAARHYKSFIDREVSLHNITAKLDDNIYDLDRYREDMAEFYELSFRRDKAFLKNIRFEGQGARGKGQESSRSSFGTRYPIRNTILITGGFHTENLAELFKKQNISYVSIMPNFKNRDGYECQYFKLLSGEKSLNIGAMLPAVLKNTLAIPDPLNREVTQALGAVAPSIAPISVTQRQILPKVEAAVPFNERVRLDRLSPESEQELRLLIADVTTNFDEYTFVERMGLIFGRVDNGVYIITKLLPVTEFEEGSTPEYRIPSREQIKKLIKARLPNEDEKVLGLYHNHSHQRLIAGQRPGPSKEDSIGEMLNIPELEDTNWIIDDRLGLVIEPAVDTSALTIEEVANFNPAAVDTILYGYITPNRGERGEINLLVQESMANLVRYLPSSGDTSAIAVQPMPSAAALGSEAVINAPMGVKESPKTRREGVVELPIANLQPLLAALKIDRVALAGAMADKATGVEEIRRILRDMSSLPIEQRRELEMALGVLLEMKAIDYATPQKLNAVVQYVDIGQGNSAYSATREIARYLGKPGGKHNEAACLSMIGEIGKNPSDEDIEKIKQTIASAIKAMDESADKGDAKTLFEVPLWLEGRFLDACRGMGLLKEGVKGVSMELSDHRIKVQLLAQEGDPDVRTQFKFGIAVLERVRRGDKIDRDADNALLNLIAFMVDSDQDPRVVLDNLFKHVMMLRKIDWRIMDQQRRAWEAIATSL